LFHKRFSLLRVVFSRKSGSLPVVAVHREGLATSCPSGKCAAHRVSGGRLPNAKRITHNQENPPWLSNVPFPSSNLTLSPRTPSAPSCRRFEAAGLKVIASRMAHLSKAEAEGFYAVHKARPFFNDLVSFMISGPVVLQVLEGEGAILKNRDLMGATDPKKAAPGTIRADFADSIDANAVHGSDAPETAAVEIAYFFPQSQVFAGR